MRKGLTAGLLVLCICLCSCGKKEEGIEQKTEAQEEVIAEGSGSGETGAGSTTMVAGEIEDPGGSGRPDASSPDGLPVLETGTLSDCITLCQIDGLKVHATLKDDPDEEDAVSYARLLKDAKPLLDAESGIKPGDVVSIDMYAVKEEDGDLTKRDVSISVGSGTGPEEIEEALQKLTEAKVERYWGDSQYDTNLEILKNSNMEGEDLVIATGREKLFYDALSVQGDAKPELQRKYPYFGRMEHFFLVGLRLRGEESVYDHGLTTA